MLKSLSRFASSFASYLSEATSSIDSEQRIEDIRAGMLDALAQTRPLQGVGRSRTWYNVEGATDIQTLWYLRSNVLHMLADCHGERIAGAKLQVITELFRGLVPKNQLPAAGRATHLQDLRTMRPSGQTPRV